MQCSCRQGRVDKSDGYKKGSGEEVAESGPLYVVIMAIFAERMAQEMGAEV